MITIDMPNGMAPPVRASTNRDEPNSSTAMKPALIATPIYDVMSTAKFALRHTWEVSALVPLMRDSAFGRGYVDFEVVLALFAVAVVLLLLLDGLIGGALAIGRSLKPLFASLRHHSPAN